MPINENLSTLPRGRSGTEAGGTYPDAEPRFGPIIAQAWYDQYLAEGNDKKDTAFGTLLRGSDAGQCARALGYKVRRRLAERKIQQEADAGADVSELTVDEPSNPPGLADSWRMGLGSMVHKFIEEIIPAAFPGAEHEVKIQGEGLDISMHADIKVTIPALVTAQLDGDGVKHHTITDPAKVVLVEVKTINGFGFKRAVGVARRGDVPEGARPSATLQGALAGYEVNADEVVVLLLSLELIGKAIAEGRGMSEIDTFCAEWTLPADVFIPLAERERTRLQAVLDVVANGDLAPRAIPDPSIPVGARITDPTKGAWVQFDEAGDRILNVGNTWQCGYCWDRDRCLADGA